MGRDYTESRPDPLRRRRAGKGIAVFLALLILAVHTPARAAGLIRDAEIENLVRDYAQPVFRAAGLSSQNIRIHLVSDRTFNAFVVDGQNMFIHVGTLMRAETPNQVIGVIAHEAGHIAGGHLSRLRQAASRARSASLMMQILGIAAMAAGAAAGGSADLGKAGMGVIMGGQGMAQRSILAYRRAEESSADQAAISYLNATGQSARGMLETFRHLADQGLGSLKYVDPYVQSHPMPQQRIVQLRELAKSSPHYDKKDPPKLQARHDMMRAKLSGFLDSPKTVFNKYPENDQSMPAKYARTIAVYRQSGVESFLPRVNALLNEEPNNPFFLELKGQFLFKSGKPGQAIPPLRKAVELAPQKGLIRILLGQALLAAGNDAYVQEAIDHLRYAVAREDTSAQGYRQLANAYGRKGAISQAELASAHAYLYEGKIDLAKKQAERAKARFKRGSLNWIKADDIINFKPPSR